VASFRRHSFAKIMKELGGLGIFGSLGSIAKAAYADIPSELIFTIFAKPHHQIRTFLFKALPPAQPKPRMKNKPCKIGKTNQ
jgi:hypothetical protein